MGKVLAQSTQVTVAHITKHFHSLRHYFATTMLEKSGGDLIAVKELMRHTSVATTQIYTQLAQGRTRSLVNLL
jgi:integrase/recombinase XerD